MDGAEEFFDRLPPRTPYFMVASSGHDEDWDDWERRR